MASIGKWLRLVAIAFSVVFTLLLLTTVYSLLPGNLSVGIGQELDMDYDTDQEMLMLRIPVTITNRGFYDIRDLMVSVAAVNSTGAAVFQTQSEPMTILGGSVFDDNVTLNVDATAPGNTNVGYHLYHSDTFSLNLTIQCRYMLSLAAITLHVPHIAFQWGAPLGGFTANFICSPPCPHPIALEASIPELQGLVRRGQ